MFSYKINYTNIFFIFLVYITMGCANLAYLTRNPFRFFECFPNFSRTLPPNDSRFLTEFFRAFPEFSRYFFEYFSKSLRKLLHIFGIHFPHMVQGTSALAQVEFCVYRARDKFFCKAHRLGNVVSHREI